MIIRRKRNDPLYFVSEDLSLSGEDIQPGIPRNFLTTLKAIDYKTPRIPLFTSLSDAISVYGMGGKDLKGVVLGVYRPRVLGEDYRIPVALDDCPESVVMEGQEIWSKVPIELTKIADIKIGDIEEIKKFRYGGKSLATKFSRVAEFKKYKWAEILPDWDKKGKTKKL